MVTASAIIPTTALITSSVFVLLPLNSLFPFSSSVVPVKYLTKRTTRTRKATARPILPIVEVVFIPTEVTIILAYPSATLVPEHKNGFWM
ncbi:hypothetical protein Leryth_017198 [Lithospermum erythrorhizon]|nr:hypothetical protein Leryth_017198 [Lithospermum erythrorhizon]